MSSIRTLRLPVLILLLLPVTAAAQDLESLAAGAQADLKATLAELTAARESIEAERLPLARRVADLEQQVAGRKAEFAKAQRFQENLLVELNALKAEARLRSDEVKYVDSVLSEYARSFRSRLNFIEEPRFAAMFDAVDQAAVAADLSAADSFSRRGILLEAALGRTESVLGGELFEGNALDQQGRVQKGKVALVGPVAMFASDSGEVAGLLQQELNRADPTVVAMEGRLDETGRALVKTGTGQLALDPTLGNAFKLAALEETLYEKVAQGGLVMIPLLGLGAAALAVAFVKWFQLSRIRLATESDLRHVLRHIEEGTIPSALAYARKITGPAGDLLATAIENVGERKEHLEELLYGKMLAARARLERGIAFLALTATAGPLMGLLGTVMGMIATFKLISSFGSGDPKLLAAGISEALIATATGMAVAIPALLLHAFLSRKAKAVVGSMEEATVGFLNGLPEPEKASFL